MKIQGKKEPPQKHEPGRKVLPSICLCDLPFLYPMLALSFGGRHQSEHK